MWQDQNSIMDHFSMFMVGVNVNLSEQGFAGWIALAGSSYGVSWVLMRYMGLLYLFFCLNKGLHG